VPEVTLYNQLSPYHPAATHWQLQDQRYLAFLEYQKLYQDSIRTATWNNSGHHLDAALSRGRDSTSPKKESTRSPEVRILTF